jgi:hypothetical protein
VYAHRADTEDHARYLAWLDSARAGEEPVAVSDVVLSGFVRVVTHPRVFVDPTPIDAALSFCRAVRESPSTIPLVPGRRHWSIFEDLCRRTGARGNAVPDSWFAALAIESGATWVSADRAFSRYPGLRWRHPLDA